MKIENAAERKTFRDTDSALIKYTERLLLCHSFIHSLHAARTWNLFQSQISVTAKVMEKSFPQNENEF